MKSYKKGFVSGNFFVLHPGHIRFLRFAASVCERLFIGVRSTRPTEVYPTVEQRIHLLLALNFTIDIFPIELPLEHHLHEIKPDVVIKGNEYRALDNPESDIVGLWGGEVLFASGDANYTSSIHSRLDGDYYGVPFLLRPRSFTARNNCDPDTLRSLVGKFCGLRILVLGDLIIDEYIACEALGMSREDATIVVSPVESHRYLGGAGIVSAHASALGASVRFISLISDDEVGDFALHKLEQYGVQVLAFREAARPTTLKQRYKCDGKTMLRVSRLSQEDPSPEIQSRIIQAVEQAAPDSDCFVFSDFSYGCITPTVVEAVSGYLHRLDITVSADSQSSSQSGDSTKVKGISLLCATEYEARSALRSQSMGLSALCAELIRRSGADNLILKLGAAGLVFLRAGQNPSDLNRIPALNPNSLDVVGAGDSLLISATMALAAGASLAQAAYIGSVAAAVQVSRKGNTPLYRGELMEALQQH